MKEGQQLLSIIQGCIQAKSESQKEFYKKFYGFSLAICMRYCAAQNDAMEVVNDGFLKIFRHLHTFDPRHSNIEASLKGWMKSIFIHTAIDHFRKNNRTPFLSEIAELHSAESSAAEDSIDKMSYKEILEMVQQLSPVYRTVFNLYVIDGFKHEEIARQLKISVGTSKSNLAKAKMNIKKMLTEEVKICYERKAV
ncbi:MAG: sigma-70 family RNA polymerase sigma factor [Gloeobacteraceae cyanobacterium ES-bin-316]|nr:sigma-70 family RNA polymerase sigma factor [Ferruginibacter sp.]